MYRGGPTYNTYVAPPVYGGYGYGGGFSLFPTFVSPVFGFGGGSCQLIIVPRPQSGLRVDTAKLFLVRTELRHLR